MDRGVMAVLSNTMGCGMFELSSLLLTDEKGMMIDICRAMQTWTGDRWSDPKQGRLRSAALMLYTATVGGAYDEHGKAFERAVTKFGLGTITKSPAVVNDLYHSNRKAIAYIWGVDKRALEKWWEENLPQDLKDLESRKAVPKIAVAKPSWIDKAKK